MQIAARTFRASTQSTSQRRICRYPGDGSSSPILLTSTSTGPVRRLSYAFYGFWNDARALGSKNVSTKSRRTCNFSYKLPSNDGTYTCNVSRNLQVGGTWILEIEIDRKLKIRRRSHRFDVKSLNNCNTVFQLFFISHIKVISINATIRLFLLVIYKYLISAQIARDSCSERSSYDISKPVLYLTERTSSSARKLIQPHPSINHPREKSAISTDCLCFACRLLIVHASAIILAESYVRETHNAINWHVRCSITHRTSPHDAQIG